MSESIIKKSGKFPGKSVAVFAGIHGDEKAGIMALSEVAKKITIERGTAYFVIANPKAVELGQRMVSKNLNRLFLKGNTGSSWEDRRARELMQILDGCDALLDLHGYNGPEKTPFIITEKNGLNLADTLPFEYVVSGISQVDDGGTDCYMSANNKVGLCLECGSNLEAEKYVELAEESIYRFLDYYSLINSQLPVIRQSQKIFNVVSIVTRQSQSFYFDRPYYNFDKLIAGKVFATDGDKKYIAGQGEYIIFPRPNQVIGQEVFTLLRGK